MSMSAGGSDGGPMSEINVTPMVDVMLVMLIIFMITTPLMQHKVKIALPNASLLQKAEDRAQSLDLAIMDDGSLYLDDNLVSEMELKAQLSVAAQTTPQPEIQIRADKNTEYKQIWDVMSDAKSVGIVHLGFKTYAEKESGQ